MQSLCYKVINNDYSSFFISCYCDKKDFKHKHLNALVKKHDVYSYSFVEIAFNDKTTIFGFAHRYMED